MLILSVVGWPVSLIFFPKEPPLVLSLSWLALIYAAIDGIFIADKEDDA